ncbi:MAG: hypothetical protein SW019_08575 [Actinomycetota bacterium]|nr:hypothetical protein [Actinomycetota bacterium]
MTSRSATTDIGLAARFAALASLGAAVIHVAVVPAHWHEWVPAGLFFVGVAVFQLIWAAAVLIRGTPAVLAAGILLNAGAIAMWVLSRTAGAPFGPHAGEPELIQAADLCALLLQIYVVMGAGWVWYRGHHAALIPAFANAMVLLGAAGVVSLASTVGVASGLQHGHHPSAGAETGHHGSQAGLSGGHHSRPAAPQPNVAVPLGTPPGPAPVPAPDPAAQPVPDAHANHDHDH